MLVMEVLDFYGHGENLPKRINSINKIAMVIESFLASQYNNFFFLGGFLWKSI